jgi:hypothetical protein
MDKLPSEILHSIFIQLDLQERLTCLTVCTRWRNVLDKGALFYSFTITNNNQFRRFMRGFERLPDYASQVEEISLHGLSRFDFNNRSMFDTFLSVRMISAQRSFSELNQPFRYISDLVYSKPKLEYLSDIGDCTLLFRIISLNLASQLNTLNLDFENFQHCQNVVSQLKDLPILKRLYIGRARVKVLDLEMIHDNLSSIQNFALIDVSILASSMPSNITPATFIKNLKFKYPRYSDTETCVQTYRYMTKKYTNLSNIEYCDKVFRDDARNIFNPSQQKHIYLNGALDFLKMVGSKQSKLFLSHLPSDVDVFEAVDAGDSKLKTLFLIKCESKTTFQYLAQSKQSKYIEDLTIIDTRIDSTIPFESMSVLTKLSIGCVKRYSRPIHLGDCLAGCPPTLKTLILRKNVVLASSFPKKLESVEVLYLGVADIICNVGDIISECFPNLLDLTLHGKVTKGVHVALRNSHFRAADIQMGDPRGSKQFKYGFSFKPTNMAEANYYMCSYQKTSQVDFRTIKNLPLLSVECFVEKKTGISQRDIMSRTHSSARKVTCKFRLY